MKFPLAAVAGVAAAMVLTACSTATTPASTPSGTPTDDTAAPTASPSPTWSNPAAPPYDVIYLPYDDSYIPAQPERPIPVLPTPGDPTYSTPGWSISVKPANAAEIRVTTYKPKTKTVDGEEVQVAEAPDFTPTGKVQEFQLIITTADGATTVIPVKIEQP